MEDLSLICQTPVSHLTCECCALPASRAGSRPAGHGTPSGTSPGVAQCSTVQYSAVQYSTVQYSAVHYCQTMHIDVLDLQ